MPASRLAFALAAVALALRSAQMKVAGSSMTGTLSGIRKIPLTGSRR